MSNPEISEVISNPPNINSFNNPKELYRVLYEIWNRTGGYKSQIVNMRGLSTSVGELNTLGGIKTEKSVQDQIDGKIDPSQLRSMAYQSADNVNITGGGLDNVDISNSQVSIKVGATTQEAQTSGTIHIDTADYASVGVTPTNLASFTLNANSLNTNSEYIKVDGWGTFAANANNKQLEFLFGSEVLLDTLATPFNNAAWYLTALIVRTGSVSQKAVVKLVTDSASYPTFVESKTPTQDLTANINVVFRGTGVTNNDVIQNGLIIKWYST